MGGAVSQGAWAPEMPPALVHTATAAATRPGHAPPHSERASRHAHPGGAGSRERMAEQATMPEEAVKLDCGVQSSCSGCKASSK